MRFNYLKTCLKTAVLITTVLLLGAGLAVAQQTINLTAAPTTVTLPDGSTVPMWGYFCGAADAVSTATCAALNPLSVSTWSPVVITVPAGQTLQINLTNSLSFAAGGGTNTILANVDRPSARHMSARVRHAFLESGPYGFVRDGGGDLRTHSYCRLPSYHDYHVSSRHSVSCRRQSHFESCRDLRCGS